MRFAIMALAACFAAAGATAQGDRTDFTCSSQLLRSVVADMPVGTRDLDPAALSCLGLSQVFFIVSSHERTGDYEQRQQVRAVFRREGLIR